MKTNKPTTNSPTTIETAKLDAVTGGCAACGSANCLLQSRLDQRQRAPQGAPQP